jgi:Subtilisin inhibitor-like
MFESCRAHSEPVVVLVLRSATLVVALSFVLAGCGGSEGGNAPGAHTVLQIEAWPNGKDRGRPREWALHCDPAEGTHPAPEKACEQLLDLDDPFAPPPPDAVCAELYGGPAVAEVEGLFRGETVNARFSRTDGCEIGRWNRHAFLFPVRPGGSP